MGIDTGVRMIVGLDYESLGIDEELDFYEVIEEMDLYRVSPYYDAPQEDCYYGIQVAEEDWQAIELNVLTLPQDIAEASTKFYKATGKHGKLFVSAHVY